MAEPHLVLLGGAGGIGRALAARAAEEGWRVTVLDLPASLERHPPAGAGIALDLADPATVAPAFAEAGPMQGFVNLAGFTMDLKPLAEQSLGEFDETMAGNYRGAFLAAKAALPGLRAGGPGAAMVTIVSGLAAVARPGYGLYGANKAAMVHMTKMLAVEWAPEIRVNAVAPAAVDTAFLRGGTGRSDETGPMALDAEAYARVIPLGRLGAPEDVVGPVLFLLGDGARYMTGQVLWVNGGNYMP